MSYLLDTNACIAALNGRPSVVAERVALAIVEGPVAVSTMSVFELWYGIAKSAQIERNMRALEAFLAPLQILPFNSEDAGVAGEIRAHLERAGTPIGPYDLLIAAQALRRALLLITANVREFSRVGGLRWADWSA